MSYWQNTLRHSQKLEFYSVRSFITDHTTSNYLDLTKGTAGRKALAGNITSRTILATKKTPQYPAEIAE